LIYRTGEEEYLAVVNAANIDKDVEWIEKHADGEVEVKNISAETAQLAIQGPLAERILQKLTSEDLSQIKFFRFKQDVDLDGSKALVSRTGYTGEDGFEIYCSPEDAVKLWDKILEAGKEEGILPCGLGARDTLRFEAKLPLYGQEITADITPIEAGLGFWVKVDKEVDFIGKEVLKEQKEKGAPRKLVGIEMVERGIPRHGYPVMVNDEEIGVVTSGTQSPTLKKNVGLALIKADFAQEGQELDVIIRGKRVKAVVVKTPFYRRPKV
jgi:aminomethyltransferase